MEAFLVNSFSPMGDGIALQAISLIHASLVNAVNKPDLESRSQMLIASLMGAVAFQKGLGVVHSLAHPLSSLLDTHHGLANAINIPYGMEFNIEGFENKFKQFARLLNLKEESGSAVVQYLFELNEKINIPRKLSAIGVKLEHIETLADMALADFAHPNNPKPVSRENFKNLYLKAF
jgi:alcohol dehydrogenase class IV